MTGFINSFQKYNWQQVSEQIYAKTDVDVAVAIRSQKPSLNDFMAMVSPAAEPFIEDMAQKSRMITKKRFGNTIQLFIPLYLSNECINHCKYCGFNHTNPINRITLTPEQVLQEIDVIKSMGYEHILLVTGESPKNVGLEYLLTIVRLIKPFFSLIALEVQPLSTNDYKQLIHAGVHTVYVYQETYHQEHYGFYHPKGMKANFNYRLETPDRLGMSGIRRIGLGVLLGLEDWRTEAFFTALHLKYLEKTYWRTRYSISFPRLRPHQGAFTPTFPISDKNLVQLITAYRILDEDVELSISVRESPSFRNHIVPLGITSMSAGSRTEPGGYAVKTNALEQFEVHDNRTPQEVVQMINNLGYEAVWKDWDSLLM